MIRASIVVPSSLQDDRLFDLSDQIRNRDDCLAPYSLLRRSLLQQGISLSTHDRHPPKTSDLVIYCDRPRATWQTDTNAKKILLLFETEAIRPDNWRPGAHDPFDIVFTWRDDLAGRGKYRKFNLPSSFPVDFEHWARKVPGRFCSLIAGNKSSRNPLELYSERMRAIEWFETNAPQFFDLYGQGWDLRTFHGLLRPLNKIPPMRRQFAIGRSSYRGRLVSKLETLSDYRFSICYENVSGTPGYITEKLLDCLFAGCVPVYLGAPNIAEHVPAECFIAKSRYSSYQELFEYLQAMSESERIAYVDAGVNFLKSPRSFQFSGEFFSMVVTQACLDLLGGAHGR